MPSHQRSKRQRQKPESPRKMILTFGHACRSRATSNFNTAQACRAASMLAGPQIRHQQLLAAEHVERQETVIAVVTVEERALLLAMHPIIRGIKIQDQFGGRRRKGGDELLHEHLMHRPGRLPVGTVLQPAERRTGSQRLVALDGGLPGQIVTERVVIIEVFITLARP